VKKPNQRRPRPKPSPLKGKRPRALGKGSRFERETCCTLSLWWTSGQRDDIFWRTSTSGARATKRAKDGLETANQHGDICATDPLGLVFLNIVCVELKRGHNDSTLVDLLDRSPKAAMQQYEKWLDQVRLSQLGRVPYWLLIHRRDLRVTIVYMPGILFDQFKAGWVGPVITLYGLASGRIVGVRFSDFLSNITPEKFAAVD
jgi:hypothetical protein